MTVVPIVTLIPEAAVARTPVRNKRRIVATWLPEPSSVVTLNGSAMQVVLGVFGLLTLQTLARPAGPLVSRWESPDPDTEPESAGLCAARRERLRRTPR